MYHGLCTQSSRTISIRHVHGARDNMGRIRRIPDQVGTSWQVPSECWSPRIRDTSRKKEIVWAPGMEIIRRTGSDLGVVNGIESNRRQSSRDVSDVACGSGRHRVPRSLARWPCSSTTTQIQPRKFWWPHHSTRTAPVFYIFHGVNAEVCIQSTPPETQVKG
ncbi:hypothetical protein B0H12DRAFT_1120518 [Mycena haematopus]|nr:hypothetical protein B0H12DRAFT_1120518 [Mycena haematopus]